MTPGQRKLIELLIESLELPEEVEAAVELLQADELSDEQAGQLIASLMQAPEREDAAWRVGGVIE